MATTKSYDQRILREEVASFLITDKAVQKIDFLIKPGTGFHQPNILINGTGFAKIGELIRSGSIRVWSDFDDRNLNIKVHGKPVVAGARYYDGQNSICLGQKMIKWKTPLDCSRTTPVSAYELSSNPLCNAAFSRTGQSLQKETVLDRDPRNLAALVHEATHAMIDLLRIPVWKARNEAAAHLAEAIYLHHNPLDPFDKQSTAGSEVAAQVALQNGLFEKRRICLGRDELKPLLKELYRTYPLLGMLAKPDGIPGSEEWKP